MPARALRLETILVPTDFSAPAGLALRSAVQLAGAGGARVLLLHVFDDSDYIVGTALGIGSQLTAMAELRDHNLAAAEKRLEALAETARQGGCEVEAVFTVGSPAAEIVRLAAQRSVDLIALSTHGRTGWRRLILGSVAEQVVREAPCGVLAVHAHPDASVVPAAADAQGLAAAPLQLRHILVATDFSPQAEAARHWAEELARAAGAGLSLLHVLAPTSALPGDPSFGLAGPEIEQAWRTVRDGAHARLRELGRSCAEHGLNAEAWVLHGSPAEKIAEAAHNWRCDLIVLATRGSGGWGQLLLGSTAERVVRFATCPVLVVRPKAPPMNS
ncbi:MAG: universal stress protein [Verrucomicrobia bacterium]|nr:universal stress protein [Verrucomicrobiota bacterium]